MCNMDQKGDNMNKEETDKKFEFTDEQLEKIRIMLRNEGKGGEYINGYVDGITDGYIVMTKMTDNIIHKLVKE